MVWRAFYARHAFFRQNPVFTVHVGLGSNLGDPEANLARALELLAVLDGVEISAVSSVYGTEPQGMKDQPWFANQVARLRAARAWTPESLLDALHAIETGLGRNRAAETRFGPRTLDLDLLDFDGRVVESARLTLPHPRMCQRAFVLVPLAEVSPGFLFPDGEGVAQALEKLECYVKGSEIHQK